MANFYTSDLHMSHKNICKFTERSRVTTPEAHNEWLISLWNAQVSPGDNVYMLGDLSFATKYGLITEVMSQLNGQIQLIQGNHDNPQFMKQLVIEGYATWCGPYKEVKIGLNKVCLFHYPIAAWNRQHHGSFHLFGHCHSNFTAVQGKALDVGIDNAYLILGEHRLFTEQDILDHMNKQPMAIADGHT